MSDTTTDSVSEITETPTSSPDQVDVRGPRFAAWITAAVLALALLSAPFSAITALILVTIQAVIFAVGAARGPRKHPYGRIFALFVAPRIGPPRQTEPTAPLRFAQLVGLVFAVLGILGWLVVNPLTGAIFTALAFFASFLNAALGICLGCQIYPLVVRLKSRFGSPRLTAHSGT